jgi:hypothetical protein
MSVTYVYAIVDPRATSGRAEKSGSRLIKVGDHRIQVISVGAVHAAVEQIDDVPAVSEDSLRSQHQLVVALGQRFDAILPVRFGATIERAELERLLNVRQKALRQALDAVRGREQMTVRIFGAEAARPAAPDQRVTGTAYLSSRRRAARVVVPPAGTRIRRAVQPLLARERIDPGRGRVRATLHHLITRGQAAEYTALVNQSLGEATSPGDVVVSGPWPPFAFTPDLWP